jgi:hypothetical protein
MLQTYRTAFEDIYIFDVPVPGTKLFVALPHSREMTRDTLLQQVREIARLHGFGYDLAGAVAGFRHSDLETGRGGSVLRD